jgi:hypothetical protein
MPTVFLLQTVQQIVVLFCENCDLILLIILTQHCNIVNNIVNSLHKNACVSTHDGGVWDGRKQISKLKFTWQI